MNIQVRNTEASLNAWFQDGRIGSSQEFQKCVHTLKDEDIEVVEKILKNTQADFIKEIGAAEAKKKHVMRRFNVIYRCGTWASVVLIVASIVGLILFPPAGLTIASAGFLIGLAWGLPATALFSELTGSTDKREISKKFAQDTERAQSIGIVASQFLKERNAVLEAENEVEEIQRGIDSQIDTDVDLAVCFSLLDEIHKNSQFLVASNKQLSEQFNSHFANC